MIAFVRGEVAHVAHDGAVIDVGGVGYQVLMPKRHLAELAEGEVVRIHTHLVHREDAMLLFGFGSQEERELFLLLTSVSGIGAKTALGVLSALTVADVVGAVVGNRPDRLAKAPGVGKKTAERVVLELREKLREWQPERSAAAGARRPLGVPDAVSEVEQALFALGYDALEIGSALGAIAPGGDPEETLRRALGHLSGL